MQRRPAQGPRSRRKRPAWQVLLLYGAALIAVLLVFQTLSKPSNSISYSRFRDLVNEGRVTDVKLGSTSIQGHYTSGSDRIAFSANNIPSEDPTFVPDLRKHHVRIEGKPDSQLGSILITWVLPLGIIVLLWFFMLRRMGGAGSALQFGKSRAKVYNRKEMRTTFDDVAGVDEAVAELREIVDFLKQPRKYQRLGGRIPKGVLLVGPPGAGKTLLARAVAGEADVPFFFISGSEFVEMFVGVGASRVRELFQQAAQQAPCIIFIDELDTIGKSRNAAITFGGHDEREQTLNQLLAEMDGFDTKTGVIIMAATNRPEVLDQALMRPGRFDRMVVVDRPDLNGRLAILLVHARKVKLGADVDLRAIAAQTSGFAGAELENVINEAALLAARRGEDAVGQSDLQEAIERVIGGVERKSRVLSDNEKEIVAHHETGHALVALHVDHHDPVHKVSIIPRGAAALGMTVTLPLEDRYLLTDSELKDRLAVLLGGRAAEEIAFGHLSTGAQDDLQKATDIARRMVEQFGMSPKVGPVSISQDGAQFLETKFPWERERHSSEEQARLADEEIVRFVREAYDRSVTILREHEKALLGVADALEARETLDGAELRALVDEIEGKKAGEVAPARSIPES